MRLPKNFIPDKKDAKKRIEELSGLKTINSKLIDQKKIDLLWELDLSRILYSNLNSKELLQSNYPDEKALEIDIALREFREKFYRYRICYYGLTKDLILFWDIFHKKPVSQRRLEQYVRKISEYHEIKGFKQSTEHSYVIVLDTPWTQESIAKIIELFYVPPFFNLKKDVVSKAFYRNLTEEEFLLSNLPLKKLETKFKGRIK